MCNTPIILTSIIDLKESPWEERLTGRFILDLRNLDLETMSPQIPNHTTTQDTNTNSHNSFQATSTTTNHNRNSRIIVLPPLSFPEPVALFSKSADESCNQSPISSWSFYSFSQIKLFLGLFKPSQTLFYKKPSVFGFLDRWSWGVFLKRKIIG